ncbi:MAG: hypothetical protein JXQ96_23925 [Cyclobacteriaceae bacterium]
MIRHLLLLLICVVSQISVCKSYDKDSTENSKPPPTLIFGFDYFPAKLMTRPVAPGADDLKLQIDNWMLGFSLPFQKSELSTITHSIEYHRLSINYLNAIPDLGALVETTHSLQYSLIWEKVLNEKWDLLTIINPGLASDFEGSLSKDDLILTLAIAGIRKYNERLSIGYGVGFNPNFGTHHPLPVLALSWNNGRNMKIETIFPINLSFAYRPNPIFDLGMDFTLDGSSYHGNPDTYGAKNPQLRYSVTKGGPSITFNIFPWLHLKCAGGITLLRRLEFYDGSMEAGSFDIKQSGFLSFNLIVGSN